MGAKKKPLDTNATGDVGIDAGEVGEGGSKTQVLEINPPPAEGGRRDHRGRGHERDGREDRRLARRKEADLNGRHPGLRPPRRRGQLQQELARARSPRPRSSPASSAPRRPRWSSATSPTTPRRARRLWRDKVFRAKSAPEGLAQPIVDVMAKVISDEGFSYALFGGGLLGFEIGAGLTARLNAGVTMEVTAVKVADGKLVAERPVLQDSAIVDVGYVGEPGIIIGRLNAFDVERRRRRLGRGRRRRGRALRVVDQGDAWSARRAARRRRQHRGRRDPGGRRPRASTKQQNQAYAGCNQAIADCPFGNVRAIPYGEDRGIEKVRQQKPLGGTDERAWKRLREITPPALARRPWLSATAFTDCPRYELPQWKVRRRSWTR